MFGIAALVAVVIGLLSGWLATAWLNVQTMPVDVVANALAVMGVVVGLRFVEGIYRSSAVGLQRQVTLNGLTSVMATVRAVGAVIVLAFISPTVMAFFLWQGIVSLASVVALGVSRPPCVAAGGPLTEAVPAPLRGVWRFAAGTLLVTLLGIRPEPGGPAGADLSLEP